jgi:thiamine biosynthesis protein ThiI
MNTIYIIRYSEIGLKGKNRYVFEDQLVKNIRKPLKNKIEDFLIKKIRGRILLTISNKNDEAYIDKILQLIAGVHSFSKGEKVEENIDVWKEKCCELFESEWDGNSTVQFRVTCTRSKKNFPQKSSEINTILGAELVTRFGEDKLKVNLKNPQINIGLEINNDGSIVYSGSQCGLGGLPVGTAGKVLCLLSGGLDSPVAAFNMMRRGCAVHYVFFENRTFLGRAAYDKVVRLAEILSQFQSKVKLHIVPFSDIQVAIRDNCDQKNRVILYRRFMYRIAEKIMDKNNMLGLVNGENLGQVASQTLENIKAVNIVVDSVVYRPLISLDKQQIVDSSKKIGTYETSIEEAPDCCSVFMPKRPTTQANIEKLIEDEKNINVEEMENSAIDSMEVLTIG